MMGYMCLKCIQRGMYLKCKIHAGYMYMRDTCILRGNQDTCWICILMYLACMMYRDCILMCTSRYICICHFGHHRKCIQHVFRMYPACILITSEDTCISYVSRMYPACLLHIRYISLWMHLRYMYLIMYLGWIPHVS